MILTVEEFIQGIERGLPAYAAEIENGLLTLRKNICGGKNDYDLCFELSLSRNILDEESLEDCITAIEDTEQRWAAHVVRTYGEDEMVEAIYD